MRALLVVVLAGCGRIGFDARAGGGGGDSGSAMPDATPIARHWINRNDGSPGALIAPRLAYVPSVGVVLYGGATDGAGDMPVAAMWKLTPSGWQTICVACAPGARSAAGLAYLALDQKLYLYGGFGPSSAPRSDLWSWDGTTWSMQNQAGTSPPALGAVALVDNGGLVLVGGFDNTLANAEVYTYATTNAKWLHPLFPAKPPAIADNGTGAVGDPTSQRVLVLSDNFGPPDYDEIWQFDATGWTQLCANCTGTKRTSASIVSDGRSYFVIGGYDDTTGFEIAGTWRSGPGSAWTQISPEPPARDSCGVVYDPSRDVIVLYGGNGVSCSTGNCAETWELIPD